MQDLNTTTGPPKPRRVIAGFRRAVQYGSAICGTVIVIVLASHWFEYERPLRQIEFDLKSKKTSDALRLLATFLKQHPQDARALGIKARMLVELGQLQEAIQLFERVGAANSTDLHAWAKALLLRREWSAARVLLERILQLNPDDADALHEIVACHSYLGNPNQALAFAEHSSRLKGQESHAYFQLGALYESLGDKRRAADAFDKVLAYAPLAEGLQVSAAEFYLAYGAVQLELGHISQAVSLLQKSLELKETAECRLRLGNAMLQSENLPLAVESWKRAVELSEYSPQARVSLAEAALSDRHFDEARAWLAPLLNRSDITSGTTHLMQRICLAGGDIDESRTWQHRTLELHQHEHLLSSLDKMIARSPNSEWAQVIRAYRFAERGNWNDAEKLMSTVANESIGDEPFVRQLSQAVRWRGSLPELTLIPVQHLQ